MEKRLVAAFWVVLIICAFWQRPDLLSGASKKSDEVPLATAGVDQPGSDARGQREYTVTTPSDPSASKRNQRKSVVSVEPDKSRRHSSVNRRSDQNPEDFAIHRDGSDQIHMNGGSKYGHRGNAPGNRGSDDSSYGSDSQDEVKHLY